MVLIVAADRMEFAGVLKHATAIEPLEIGLDWSRRVRIRGFDAVLAANGAGVARAAAAVDAAAARQRPDAVVSTGFCGALNPGLKIAEIVVADVVRDGDRTYPALPPGSNRTHHTGIVVTIGRVAQTAAEKSRLRASGGDAVDMEAAGVARIAEAWSARFYCVRAVSDLAGEDMANDFNEYLQKDGHFATISILSGALKKPLVRLPELFRLRRRCARAALALGDFIADCRF